MSVVLSLYRGCHPSYYILQGKFKVSLDDKVTEASASATKSDTLDAVLFSSPSQLNNTHHRLILRNAAEHNHSTSVELDYITITTGDGNAR